MTGRPPVALVHDYLTQRGGGERVVLTLADGYPGATIHTSLYDPQGTFPGFAGHDVATLPLDRVRLLRDHHRLALPFLAPAFSRLVVDADVTICSSSGWAHGAQVTGSKIVYCHNPARWLYQRDLYLAGSSPPVGHRAGRPVPLAAPLGPAGGSHRRPLPGQLPGRPGTGGRGLRDRRRRGPPAGRHRRRRRPSGPGGHRAGLRAVRVAPPPLQERRRGRRGLRPATGTATGRRRHGSAVRGTGVGGAGQCAPAREGGRRGAALALRGVGGPGGRLLRGLRPHPDRSGGVRTPHRGAAVGRIPRHHRRGRDRRVLRRADPGRHRRRTGRAGGDELVGRDADGHAGHYAPGRFLRFGGRRGRRVRRRPAEPGRTALRRRRAP